MTVDFTIQRGEPEETKAIPAGAGCAGRTETEKAPAAMQEKKKFPRRRTVKGKKRRKGHRHKKNPGGRAVTGKRDGQHVPRGVYEAMAILRKEGYIVGKIIDPESAFDIMGWSPRGSILVTVIRPKEPVANAHDVTELYDAKVRKMQPYCRSDADNIQFWVFSRENGLIRYRVFDWGIGNEEKILKSMQKKHVAPSDKQIAASEPANRRARNSPCPDEPTGNARAPVDTPLHAAITT